MLFIIIFGTLWFPVVALDILKRFRSDRRGQNVKQVGLVALVTVERALVRV